MVFLPETLQPLTPPHHHHYHCHRHRRLPAAALLESGDAEACIKMCERAIEVGNEFRADFKLKAKRAAFESLKQ